MSITSWMRLDGLKNSLKFIISFEHLVRRMRGSFSMFYAAGISPQLRAFIPARTVSGATSVEGHRPEPLHSAVSCRFNHDTGSGGLQDLRATEVGPSYRRTAVSGGSGGASFQRSSDRADRCRVTRGGKDSARRDKKFDRRACKGSYHPKREGGSTSSDIIWTSASPIP